MDHYPTIVLTAMNYWYWATNGQGNNSPRNERLCAENADLCPMRDTRMIAPLPFTAKQVGLGLFGFIYGVLLLRAITQTQKRNEFFYAACLYCAFFMLPTQIHDRYIYPALVMFAFGLVCGHRSTLFDRRVPLFLAAFTVIGMYGVYWTFRDEPVIYAFFKTQFADSVSVARWAVWFFLGLLLVALWPVRRDTTHPVHRASLYSLVLRLHPIRGEDLRDDRG